MFVTIFMMWISTPLVCPRFIWHYHVLPFLFSNVLRITPTTLDILMCKRWNQGGLTIPIELDAAERYQLLDNTRVDIIQCLGVSYMRSSLLPPFSFTFFRRLTFYHGSGVTCPCHLELPLRGHLALGCPRFGELRGNLSLTLNQ
jgi:hypothetical protein